MASKAKNFYKRAHVLLILLLFLTFSVTYYILQLPQTAGTSVARKNYATCSNEIATNIFCTVSPPSNGSSLIAVIGTRGSAANRVSSITQTGATWQRAVQSTATNNTTEIWYTTSTNSASTNITISLAEPVNASAIIAQYSGLITTDTLDKTAYNNGDSSVANTGTTSTTSQSNQLWVGGLTISDINSFANPDNDFTKIAESASTGGSDNIRNNTTYLEKIVTVTGQATTSSAISASQWSGAIATFNASGAPTQIAFTNEPFTLVAGTCSSAITVETRDSGGAAVPATENVIIQISSTGENSRATFYTTPDCNESAVREFRFNGSESSKTFYLRDNFAGTGLGIYATKISGSDTLTDASLSYSVIAGPMSRIGIMLPGQSLPYQNGKAKGTPSTLTAGTSFSISELRALDQFDNTVTSYSGVKSINYSGPNISPSNNNPFYTTSVNFSNGTSTTNLLTTLFKAEANVTLTATEDGLFASPTPDFIVDAAVLAYYSIATSSTNVFAGSCPENTIDITAKDTYGNQKITDTSNIVITSTAPGIIYYSNNNCQNVQSSFGLANGFVRIYWKPTKKATGANITVTKIGDTPSGTFGPINIIPGPVNALLIKLPGQSFADGNGLTGAINFPGLRSPNATAGESFNVSLYAVDSYFNLVDSGPYNYTGIKSISWANSSAGSSPNGTTPLLPTNSVNFINGLSTTSLDATFYLAEINRNLRADEATTPISGNLSSNFTVMATNASSFNVAVSTPQKAGVEFNLFVTARDNFNNILGSLYSPPSGTFAWNSTATSSPDGTSPILGNLSGTDFVNGTATKQVTLYKAQSVTFTASEPSPSTVSGTSDYIYINPGDVSADANDSNVIGNSSGFDSRAETITITLKDTWRNPVPNVSKANITVSGTGGASVEQPIINTDANGVTTAQITWITIGTYTVRASIANVKLVQNDGFTVDFDGFLDSSHTMIIYENHPSARLQGGTKILGGTRIQ